MDMSLEKRLSLGDVGPFRKARAPPFVVLGDRMELRKVERDYASAWIECPGPVGGRLLTASRFEVLRQF